MIAILIRLLIPLIIGILALLGILKVSEWWRYGIPYCGICGRLVLGLRSSCLIEGQRIECHADCCPLYRENLVCKRKVIIED